MKSRAKHTDITVEYTDGACFARYRRYGGVFCLHLSLPYVPTKHLSAAY